MNRHRMFWSNMSDGSAELGYTDKSFEKHMEEYQRRNEHIYESVNHIISSYPDKQQQVFHEICEAMRKVKAERNL